MESAVISITHYATLSGHLSDVTWVDFAFNILATCSSDKTVRLWDMSKPEQGITELGHSPLLGHRYIVYCCNFSPFGKMLATCSRDGLVILWDPKNGNIICTLSHPSHAGVRVCRFSPDSSRLATGGDDDTLIIWDVLSRTILRTFCGHDAAVTACSFTPDNHFVISGSMNGDLRVWNVTNSDNTHVVRECEGHDLGVLCCEFSPRFFQSAAPRGDKEYLLASCGNDKDVRLFNVTIGLSNSITLKSVLKGHEANVMCCRFSPSGRLLATASGDKTIIIWDVELKTVVQKLIGHQRYVTSCAFSQCGRHIASASNDKTVMIWNLSNYHLNKLATDTVGTLDVTVRIQPFLNSKKGDGKIPNEFCCPITQEVMRDPVIAADGFSYERNAIKEWFNKGKNSSPMTNGVLAHTQLTPNYALRTLIQRYDVNSSQ